MDHTLPADSIAEFSVHSPARQSTLPVLLAVSLVCACLVVEAAVLRVGIDDLDEGYFVQQAVRVLHGQVPYRDFATFYSPGLAYVHAVLFSALGLIPVTRPSRADVFGSVQLDYKLVLNILGLIVFSALFWLSRKARATAHTCPVHT